MSDVIPARSEVSSDEQAGGNGTENGAPDGLTSRRKLFQLGAVGAAAAAGAAVAQAVGAPAADAATGDAMIVGETNLTTKIVETSFSFFPFTILEDGGFLVATTTSFFGLAVFNQGGTGILGTSPAGSGVEGYTTKDVSVPGVLGISNPPGTTTSLGRPVPPTGGIGVQGLGTTGVLGQSSNVGTKQYYGVQGVAGGTGVSGVSTGGGPGLQGSSTSGPSLLLEPSGATVPPTTGTWSTGAFLVRSSDGALFFCYSGGTPGKWIQLNSTLVPLVPLVRAYDSRSGAGPLANGTERVVSLASAIPAGAASALINLTIVNTVDRGNLTVFENGTSFPGTSNINWFASSQVIANNATTAVDSSRNIKVHAGGQVGGQTDFIVDVMGYYL